MSSIHKLIFLLACLFMLLVVAFLRPDKTETVGSTMVGLSKVISGPVSP